MTAHDKFFPKPPSAFHNAAWMKVRANPGHEIMQQQVLAFLRQRRIAGLAPGGAVYRDVEGEMPLVRRGQIVAYADAAEILQIDLTRIISLFEIKPAIETVFGIVRQAKALLELAKAALPADQHWCHIVVPAADPKLDDLRVEWPHVWAWGIQFERVGFSDVS